MWALETRQLEPRVPQREPVSLEVYRLLAPEQEEDGLESLFHHVPLLRHLDAHHERVGWQGTWTHAEHDPATGEVIEQLHAVGQHQWLVVWERRHASPEPDVPSALRRHGDEDLGRRDYLVAGGMVLADPRLVEAEPVEVDDQVEVAPEAERWVLAHRVERREEDAEVRWVCWGGRAHNRLLLRR